MRGFRVLAPDIFRAWKPEIAETLTPRSGYAKPRLRLPGLWYLARERDSQG